MIEFKNNTRTFLAVEVPEGKEDRLNFSDKINDKIKELFPQKDHIIRVIYFGPLSSITEEKAKGMVEVVEQEQEINEDLYFDYMNNLHGGQYVFATASLRSRIISLNLNPDKVLIIEIK